MKKNVLILLIALSATFIFSVFNGPEDESHQVKFNKNYAIYALNQPKGIGFAGEKMPLEQHDIKEKLDRELLVNTYWQSQTILFIKKSYKYFPIIEPILKKEGIPDDFKYLAIAESGLSNIISPAGATGMWQIMKSTAKENGLIVDKEVDERYHLAKSTKAACDYLNEAYRKFGSWTLAAAAYNMGMTGLKKQIERQNVNSYYDLLLNSETGRYVYRIAAIKEILENQKKYGFHVREKDLYTLPPLNQVILDSSVTNFAQYAEQNGVNYKILKEYNPWLRQAHLENESGWAFLIDLPDSGYFTSENKVEHYNSEAIKRKLEFKKDTFVIEIEKTKMLSEIAAEQNIQIEELFLQNLELLDIKVKKGQEIQVIK